MVNQAPVLDLTKYIDTRFFGERPHVRGRRIPVAAVAYNAQHNDWDLPRLCQEFTVSPSEVLAALLYYEEHREQVDAQERDYQAQLDDAYERHGR